MAACELKNLNVSIIRVINEANGVVAIYVYQGGGLLYRCRYRNGAPVSVEYAKQWTSINQDPATMVFETAYNYQADTYQRITQKTDNLNRNKVYEHQEPSGSTTRTTFYDNTFETTTYNANYPTLPAHYVDRLGRITDCTYDASGNLLSRTVAVGTAEQASWNWTYWPNQNQNQGHHTY